MANAIHVWGIARARRGKVLLRLEDHDRGRCRPEYEAAILQDLEWLGLEPDVGLPAEYRAGVSRYRQSDNGARYEGALEHLATQFHVYGCDCSRETSREVPMLRTMRLGTQDAVVQAVSRQAQDAGREWLWMLAWNSSTMPSWESSNRIHRCNVATCC